MRKLLCLTACVAVFCSLSFADDGNKQVITSLEAKWHHTSFIGEASEFIAQENNASYFQYLDLIVAASEASTVDLSTPEKEYDSAIKMAAQTISDNRLDLLKLALSLRVASPAIELFQQLGKSRENRNKCLTFVDINGEIVCNQNELNERAESISKNVETFSVDHIYVHKSANTELPIVALYGRIGDKDFATFYNACKKIAKKDKFQFAIRYFDGRENKDDTPVALSGYGVELSIKNTEYKAIDDTNQKKEDVDEESPANQDIHGLNFNILRKKHEHLRKELNQLKVHFAESEELTPLKQWEVQDIALQAGQRVVNEPNAEAAINTLIDLSQNFPVRARSIVQTTIDKAYKAEVEANQERLKEEFGISAGDNAMFINGINIEADSLDIYQLLDTLKAEDKLAGDFFEMGFRKEYLGLLFSSDTSEDKSSFAIDVREAFPEYINNLDKDPEYKRMGNSIKLLLQPYYPNMIRPIARNLYTLVLVVNPEHVNHRVLLKIAHSFYSHQIPIRIGIVWDVSNEETENGMNNAAVAFVNFYNYAKSEKTPAQALNLCNKMFDLFMEDFTVQNIHNFFKKYFKDVEISEVFGQDSDYNQGRATGRSWLKKSGLGESPKVMLNGVVFEETSLSADKIEEALSNEITKQTPTFQKAVMEGKLSDKG
uniref:UDP-glucose:glycoprotein glucosyltransferase n=1 Tax=Rhabditophanes sp. KR3021 TaxID=114890 RepID=A0AC35TQK5_9BILA